MLQVRSFTAGFVSTLLFHQGLLGLLHTIGLVPKTPYNMSPTIPLGVPNVLSLAFFGGLWGILIWQLIANQPVKRQLIRSILFGAVGPTLVAFFIVLPLKGLPMKPMFLPLGLLLNGTWGLGLWVFMQIKKDYLKKT